MVWCFATSIYTAYTNVLPSDMSDIVISLSLFITSSIKPFQIEIYFSLLFQRDRRVMKVLEV